MTNIVSKLSSDFFAQLRKKGIRYCHWKSNNHLEEGLIGNTDLDLLICPDHKEQFQEALSRFGFKRIIASTPKQFPGMEDYLGCDLPTGKLIHLHVHYKLILGQKYIKNHHLPIERFVLGNLDLSTGIFVPKKEIELFLLCIRASMKLGIKEVVRYFFGRLNAPFPEEILQEFRFLLDSSKPDDLRRMIHESGLPVSQYRLIQFTEKLRHDRLTLLDVLALRHYLLKVLRPFRRRHPIHCLSGAFFSRLRVLPGVKRVWPLPRKRPQRGGASFALVGADGSGKSTLVEDLYGWLSWKLEVRQLYFGIPKTIGLRLVNGLALSLRYFSRMPLGKSLKTQSLLVARSISALRWIWIARKRMHHFRRLNKSTARGFIVLADRFPLTQFRDMAKPMDGPRIRGEWGGVGNRFSEREESYYNRIGKPNRVFVLKVDTEQLRRRKCGLDIGTSKAKAAAVNSVKGSEDISVINANRPYPEVLLDLKRAIWELL